MELTKELIAELEGGVTQTRMAELAGISAAALRGFEKDGLVPLHANTIKKLYGAASLEALGRIKTLKASGASLEEMKAQVLPAVKSEAQLMAELEVAKTKLEATSCAYQSKNSRRLKPCGNRTCAGPCKWSAKPTRSGRECSTPQPSRTSCAWICRKPRSANASSGGECRSGLPLQAVCGLPSAALEHHDLNQRQRNEAFV